MIQDSLLETSNKFHMPPIRAFWVAYNRIGGAYDAFDKCWVGKSGTKKSENNVDASTANYVLAFSMFKSKSLQWMRWRLIKLRSRKRSLNLRKRAAIR